ncbi:hypothetical protein MKW98_008878 [Papaver atlanticum]|uniref:Plasma membrane-associated cation-binding protein 1 n=1 Tax=Papaver atlanticum TaxID=357466 RepID=A0AAD4S2K7_9MAGN|nr:hypothetical protein MKW98_008878 [Papaver atlanticum]
MAGYWQTRVLPRLKKVFDKDGKKAAAADACKSFADSKEVINKEFEEKKPELETKVLAVYEASSTEIKTLVKERKTSGVKKHSANVQKFLDELSGIDFPGAKQVCEASKTLSPALVSKPILFLFEKVSTFVVIPEVEVKDKELPAAPATTEEAATTEQAATTVEAATTTTEEITPETTTTTAEPAEKEVVVVAEPVPETTPVVCEPAKAEVAAEPVKAEVAESAVTPAAAKP